MLAGEKLNVESVWLENDGDYFDNDREHFYYDKLDDKTKKYISQANCYIESQKDLEDTIKPIAKLVLFNELSRSGDTGYSAEAADKIRRMQQSEESYLKIKELPTVGIEVECDRCKLTPDKAAVLDEMRIPNKKEGDDLREVNSGYTYSPYSQARTLEELVKFGAIPKEVGGDGKSSINNNFTYSLHVNFGIPEELNKVFQTDKNKVDDKKTYPLTDPVTYAFISPKRIMARKTNFSVFINNDARKSKKYINEIESAAGNAGPKRIEYRANEFRNYSTFRMIAETQRLAAMFFSFLKAMSGKQTNDLDIKFSHLWVQFSAQFQDICRKYGIQESNLADKDKNQVYNLLEKTDLPKECRSLISEFSRQAMSAIKEYYKIDQGQSRN